MWQHRKHVSRFSIQYHPTHNKTHVYISPPLKQNTELFFPHGLFAFIRSSVTKEKCERKKINCVNYQNIKTNFLFSNGNTKHCGHTSVIRSLIQTQTQTAFYSKLLPSHSSSSFTHLTLLVFWSDPWWSETCVCSLVFNPVNDAVFRSSVTHWYQTDMRLCRCFGVSVAVNKEHLIKWDSEETGSCSTESIISGTLTLSVCDRERDFHIDF